MKGLITLYTHTLAIVLFFVSIALASCSMHREDSACKLLVVADAPVDVSTTAYFLLSNSWGVTSSRRGETEKRGLVVEPKAVYVSQDKKKVFAIIWEKEPNHREDPASMNIKEDTLVSCFSLGLSMQQDSSWKGYILQHTYFVSYGDTARLTRVVCKAYSVRDKEQSAFYTMQGELVRDRFNVVIPGDKDFFDHSPLWSELEHGELDDTVFIIPKELIKSH